MSLITSSTREIFASLGRILKATAVFETYWRFAAKRQDLFMRRIKGGLTTRS